MVQLELFKDFQFSTKGNGTSASVAGNGKNGKSTTPSPTATTKPWQYFDYFCSISERKIYELLERFQIKHLFSREEIQDLARTTIVDLMRYPYPFFSRSLIEKFTTYTLKRYLRSENPLIVYHTEIPERLGL